MYSRFIIKIFSPFYFQGRPTQSEGNVFHEPKWHPEDLSLEEFYRCHGAPCAEWERTREKLRTLMALEQQVIQLHDMTNIQTQVSTRTTWYMRDNCTFPKKKRQFSESIFSESSWNIKCKKDIMLWLHQNMCCIILHENMA